MWKKYTISVDPMVWDNAKQIIQTEAGMSMSKYIEITLRALPRAQEGTAKDFVQDTIMDFVTADKTLSSEEKKKAEILIMGKKAKPLKKKK